MNYKISIPKIAVILYFIMFIYSGIMKIVKYNKKVETLTKKTGLPYPINDLGMIGVILLEIFGSLIVVYHFWGGKINKKILKYVLYTFMLFLIVVTPLYHPPTKNIIPFLANITTFGGLLFIYNLI